MTIVWLPPVHRYASRFIVDQFGSQVIPALYQLLRNQVWLPFTILSHTCGLVETS